MENEELEVQPVEGETQTEQDTATNGETETKIETKEPDWKAEALKYKAIAERKDKQLKKPNNNELTRDEVILLAKGIEDSDITYLKKLQAGEKAMGNEISLADAMSDPLFVAFKEQREAKARTEKAQLGASGSGAIHQDTQFVNNLSKEDHKALWQKEMEKY